MKQVQVVVLLLIAARLGGAVATDVEMRAGAKAR
jgi:hypothetical protein